MDRKMKPLTEEDVWEMLESVKDPEIPVVSVVEMGIVREVTVSEGKVQVAMTPTFTGCPAIHVMRRDIEICLRAAGVEQVDIRLQNSPPWTSDWIKPEAREKLRRFGLAPPPIHRGNLDILLDETHIDVARCPYCGSDDTTLQNSFGPTLCRAIYTCQSCRQPFEAFKPI